MVMHTLQRLALRQFTRRARPYLKSYGLLRTVKYKNALVGLPEAARILVLAPHMDDEVIGCGGAICQHVRRGADVKVIFLTDGRLGSRELLNLSGQQRRQREQVVAATRKQEAECALDVLGVRDRVYWDAEEMQLVVDPTLPGKLHQALQSFKPDLVYLPFFLEEQADHRAVNHILAQALRDEPCDFDCMGYEIWTPLFPNLVIEISDVIETKKRALAEYKSQLADSNYMHSALGLSAYRSSALLETGGYAEAFFAAPAMDYLALFREFSEPA
ncbi:MAG TPA: PIG-L deacetylase family protein [Anaerolineae bacterium]